MIEHTRTLCRTATTIALLFGVLAARAEEPSLPDVKPLEWQGDVASHHIASAHRDGHSRITSVAA